MNDKEKEEAVELAKKRSAYDFDDAPVADKSMIALDPEKKTFALFDNEKVIAIVPFDMVMKMATTVLQYNHGIKPDNIVYEDDEDKILN